MPRSRVVNVEISHFNASAEPPLPGPSSLESFQDRLTKASIANDSLLCVGLDPDIERFPASLRHESDIARAIVTFNMAIIEATHDLVSAYKPNLGFYLAHGTPGLVALAETRKAIPSP